MKRKGTGRSQRQSFLDRDVVRENREIMAYNRQVERVTRQAERERETERIKDAIMSSVKSSESTKWALELLVAKLTRRERFGDAAKEVWAEMVERTGGKVSATERANWNHTLSQVAQKANMLGIRGVPAGLVRAGVRSNIAFEMLIAGLSVERSDEVEKMVERAADLLETGISIKEVNEQVWRWGTKGLDIETRRKLAPAWSNAIRKMEEVWVKTHPQDQLPSLEEERQARRAKAIEMRKAQLTSAGESVDSWSIFSYEGKALVDLIAQGEPLKEALSKAGELLNERAPKVSPAEWQVVRSEWAKIVNAITDKNAQLIKER